MRRQSRASTQIADIAGKIRSCGRDWRNIGALTKAKKVIEATGVGIQRIGSKSEQLFGRQPGLGEIMNGDELIAEPFNIICIGRLWHLNPPWDSPGTRL